MNSEIKFSIVIPVYGCSSCLIELEKRLTLTLNKINSDFEIILINDGSHDNAWQTIKKLSADNNKVRGMDLSRNFGQHNAIRAGLDMVRGEWIIVMDCDLQDQPEEIERLYKKAMEGFDVVFGKREDRKDKFIKKFNSKIFYLVLNYLTDFKFDNSIANFGIYHRDVIENVKKFRENLFFLPLSVMWVGFKQTSINVQHDARYDGKTAYNFKKLIFLAFNVIFAFSNKPLYLILKLGLYISALSFIYAIYVVIKAFTMTIPVVGWSSLMASLFFLAGVIIFVLGLIGLYIGKIFNETKSRPPYIIKEKI